MAHICIASTLFCELLYSLIKAEAIMEIARIKVCLSGYPADQLQPDFSGGQSECKWWWAFQGLYDEQKSCAFCSMPNAYPPPFPSPLVGFLLVGTIGM